MRRNQLFIVDFAQEGQKNSRGNIFGICARLLNDKEVMLCQL